MEHLRLRLEALGLREGFQALKEPGPRLRGLLKGPAMEIAPGNTQKKKV